jgi:hypothetical protein
MRSSRRWGLIGIAIGCGVAVWCGLPQAQADREGVKVMGYAEAMFVLSLPFSFVTWLGWLIPASVVFGPGGGQIPRWVGYTWMLLAPPLNWGLVGWLIGKWRDRRADARIAAIALGEGP